MQPVHSVTTEDIIYQCRRWVEDFIIKHSICPFARAVYETNGIEYAITKADNLEDQLLDLMGLVQTMKSNPTPETVLLILPTGVSDFEQFLNLLQVANELLEQLQESDFVQLASFHPDYLFEGEEQQSASHFTNRSPWPMLHLIRQDSVAQALANTREPQQIPLRNIQFMEQFGVTELQKQLQQIQSLTA